VEAQEFGDYLLLKKIATGGMGEVYLARQEQGWGFQRYVVIKRILPDLTGDDEFVRMFLDEARIAAKLDHPNVVQIFDLGICGDQYYIAMEFLEGRDTRRLMARLSMLDRVVPGAYAVQIIYGAAEGLSYAHELKDAYGRPMNIIHRDVSPQNIFVTGHGSIKVLDFGIAKAEVRSVRTRTGGLKGKYPYLSPEQVRGEDIDQRSDIFALGTVMWELTVGRRLFKRDNDLLTLQAVAKSKIPKPTKFIDNYPPDLEAIVLKALAREREDRYANCRALQEDLEQFMGAHGLVLSPQRFGKYVRGVFQDEPFSIDGILESLKTKPRSMSLLFDLHDGSASPSGLRGSDSRGSDSQGSNSHVRLSMSDADDSQSRSVAPFQLEEQSSSSPDLSSAVDQILELPTTVSAPAVAPGESLSVAGTEGLSEATVSDGQLPTTSDDDSVSSDLPSTKDGDEPALPDLSSTRCRRHDGKTNRRCLTCRRHDGKTNRRCLTCRRHDGKTNRWCPTCR
jgi:serine/threonine protein kinase